MICPYCQGEAELVLGREIYPHRADLHQLFFWRCLPCDAYVGCHKTGDGKSPLGRLADAELRQAKKEAHAIFDPIWTNDKKQRKVAYRWLTEQLQIDTKSCHIGMFDVEMCRLTIEICKSRRDTDYDKNTDG
jgi:zinc-finger-containing domain